MALSKLPFFNSIDGEYTILAESDFETVKVSSFKLLLRIVLLEKLIFISNSFKQG